MRSAFSKRKGESDCGYIRSASSIRKRGKDIYRRETWKKTWGEKGRENNSKNEDFRNLGVSREESVHRQLFYGIIFLLLSSLQSTHTIQEIVDRDFSG
ncbi:hypothetical protein EJ02DRAFT_81044 [Clathrospora elynae]|uniref:Uncharacterized protein n=1 Tax=Clathrospora elynae TaxID=706981 RepID=A0A6A5S7I1_9PLEO|nr:hypothetical protein EJ02DRAFT_81044 [Clathrospora elynae]